MRSLAAIVGESSLSEDSAFEGELSLRRGVEPVERALVEIEDEGQEDAIRALKRDALRNPILRDTSFAWWLIAPNRPPAPPSSTA